MSSNEAVLEPSLSELFKDPIIQMLMKKDGVKDADLMPELRNVAKKIQKTARLVAA